MSYAIPKTIVEIFLSFWHLHHNRILDNFSVNISTQVAQLLNNLGMSVRLFGQNFVESIDRVIH